jgi:tetratricopeptide (TPR) repeat protein
MNRIDEARQHAAAATERHPDDATLWLLRATLIDSADRSQLAEALQWADRAVQLDPLSVDALLLRAKWRIALDPLESDAAAADVRKAKAIAPNHPEVHVVQSRLAVLQGDLDGAMAACGRAVRLSPGYIPAYMQRFYVRLLQGDTPTSYVANLRDCNTVLALKPQDWETRLVRADLFTKLDLDRLAELARDPQQMMVITAPIVVEHIDKLSILPALQEPPTNANPDEALAMLNLVRAGFVEAAAADLEKAAADVPPEIRDRIRERAREIRAALQPPPEGNER